MNCIIGPHFVQRETLLALLPCVACRRIAGSRLQASNMIERFAFHWNILLTIRGHVDGAMK